MDEKIINKLNKFPPPIIYYVFYKKLCLNLKYNNLKNFSFFVVNKKALLYERLFYENFI